MIPAQRQTANNVGLPAPVRGVVATNAYGGLASGGEATALYIYNMIAADYGCRVRRGSREYAINLLDKTGNAGDVRSLMYYNSTQAGGALDRFFATTDKGIYDITGGTDTVMNGAWVFNETSAAAAGEYTTGPDNIVFHNEDANGIDYAAALATVAVGDWIYLAGPLGRRAYMVDTAPVPGPDPDTTSIGIVVMSDEGIFEAGQNIGIAIYREADLVLEWSNQSDDAGWCSVANYTNVAGDHYLLVCDEANGYWIFDGTTWDQPNINVGPDATELVHVTEWQGRLFFTERNSATLWYMDVLEILDQTLTGLPLGSRFIAGGHLVMTSTWTLDGGDGMDDKLVAISSAGDVLVLGSNVDLGIDAFIVQGRWQIGRVPEGRRVMSKLGGDVQILTVTGLVRLSDILQGLMVIEENKFVTYNISRFLRLSMREVSEEYGWEIGRSSQDGIIIITVPRSPLQMNEPPVQYVLDVNSNAWSIFRDLDMRCTNENNEGFFFGTSDGRVMKMTGTVDEAKLDGSSSKGIKFSMLTHYSNFGAPANWKQVQFVRPWWIGDSDPAYRTKIMYDFFLGEIEDSPVFTGSNVALWDNAIWDIDKWTVTAQNYWETLGAKNMGRHVSLAIKGETALQTTYLGADLMMTRGGML